MPVVIWDHDGLVKLFGSCDCPHRDGTFWGWVRWALSPCRCDRCNTGGGMRIAPGSRNQDSGSLMDSRSDWGEYEGKKRLPCPENPVELLGQPIGQYHCPYCGMMVLAGIPHLSPSPPAEHDPRYPLDHYEDEYGAPWPPGYEGERS